MGGFISMVQAPRTCDIPLPLASEALMPTPELFSKQGQARGLAASNWGGWGIFLQLDLD